MKILTKHLALPLVAMGLLEQSVSAEFWQITTPSTPNVGGQLTLNLTRSGDFALFSFQNIGAIDSVVTTVYFDYLQTAPNLITAASVDTTRSQGVDFVIESSPGTLQGAGGYPTYWNGTDLSVQADQPPPHNGIEDWNGIGVGDRLVISMQLFWNTTTTRDTSYSSLESALRNGTFRVGLHVQAIQPGNYSQAYLYDDPNGGPTPPSSVVPEPGTILAGALLLLPFGASVVRRFRRK